MQMLQRSIPSTVTTDDARWQAVVTRDRAADNQFVYSVRTTGVFCRPSCPARLARRENVRFHLTCADAETAGFRACKRCRPKEVSSREEHLARIAQACRALDNAERVPPLAELAATAGLSRFHFHRLFKEVTGVTPKAYALATRAQRLRENLPRSATVTTALFDSGYQSSSRFYREAPSALGMQPTAFRQRGKNLTIHFAFGKTSLGNVLVAATEVGICAILFGDERQALEGELQQRFSQATLIPAPHAFAARVNEVIALIEHPTDAHRLPLDIRGTAFQQQVWQALRKVPAGSTVSYGELAARIDSPKAVRAVARACAMNPLAVAVPCHRVVHANGDTAGYRWGNARKRALLAREQHGAPKP